MSTRTNNQKENEVPFSSIEACNERLEKLPKDIREILEKVDFNILFALLVQVCKDRYYETKKELEPSDQLFKLREYEVMWLGCAKNFLISFRNSHHINIKLNNINLPKILTDYFNDPSNSIKQLMQILIDILHSKEDKTKRNETDLDFYYEVINLYKTITGEWKSKKDKSKDHKMNNPDRMQYQSNNYQNGRGYHNAPQNGILGPGPKHYGGHNTFDPQRRTNTYYKNNK